LLKATARDCEIFPTPRHSPESSLTPEETLDFRKSLGRVFEELYAYTEKCFEVTQHQKSGWMNDHMTRYYRRANDVFDILGIHYFIATTPNFHEALEQVSKTKGLRKDEQKILTLMQGALSVLCNEAKRYLTEHAQFKDQEIRWGTNDPLAHSRIRVQPDNVLEFPQK